MKKFTDEQKEMMRRMGWVTDIEFHNFYTSFKAAQKKIRSLGHCGKLQTFDEHLRAVCSAYI